MDSGSDLKVLLVADGSGGHLIPALEVARALAQAGARVRVWYARRSPTATLADALARQATEAGIGGTVHVDPIPLGARLRLWGRLWEGGQLWSRARRCFDSFAPDVVVGFGGWISAPVVLAAKTRRIHCLIHEQNAVMGRANRLLARWVDRIALSFEDTRLGATPATAVTTGLPVRRTIGHATRSQAARRFGFDAQRPTLLILGGSQGARAINWLMAQAAAHLTPDECAHWQILHLTGQADEAAVRSAYAVRRLRAWVAPFLMEMELAFAHADVAVSRAGASTIAELSRCGLPAVLIPYPYAGAHQRANAELAEAVGGAVVMEEDDATPSLVLDAVRRLMSDPALRATMGQRVQELHVADAARRLRDAIVAVARSSDGR